MGKIPTTGDLLIAEPFMEDERFQQAVILLCGDDGADGTFGFILNKPSGMMLNDVTVDFPTFETPLFWGGPVEDDSYVSYVHTVGDILGGSKLIAPGLWWGGELNQLKFLIKAGLVTPADIRFYLGYTGWTDGQMLEEYNDKSWIAANADPNYLFAIHPSELWDTVLKHKGSHYEVLAEVPKNTNLN